MTSGALRGAAALAALLVLLLSPAPPAAAQRLQCDRCHAELELLRQRVPRLAEAEPLLVPSAVVAASAHAELECSQCHTGATQYPHRTVTTSTCVSCHAAADSAWQWGVHARVQDREPVGCTSCHGIHDVLSRAQMATSDGRAVANAKCVSCHEGQQLGRDDAHRGQALCASCHGAHAVEQPQRASSLMHPFNQLQTCGSCHDSIARLWQHDVHADTLRRLQAAGAAELDPETLTGCTACHSGHGMVAPSRVDFTHASVERCAGCHEERARTFFKSYHGKATSLGSEIAASCANCHGAHGIRPSSEPASRVHQANLVATCKACHEHAREAFVKYDSHPDPFDRDRNPWIFAAFWLMNGLLTMTLLVFGTHTVLWWLRIVLDRRKAARQGAAAHSSHADTGPAPGSGSDHDHHAGEGA